VFRKFARALPIFFLTIAAAVAVLAAPAGFYLLWHAHPAAWPQELLKYQVLAGALVALFAAGLATTGVLLTICNQRLTTNRQIAAQASEQAKARRISQKQVASAFIGEIGALLEDFKEVPIRETVARTLRTIESGTGRVRVETINLGDAPPRYYAGNPGNIGLFAPPLPEQLARFYGYYGQIQHHLKRFTAIVEESTRIGMHPQTVSPEQVTSLLKDALGRIDAAREIGGNLLDQLGAIRDDIS
jgi:hypothetical protein